MIPCRWPVSPWYSATCICPPTATNGDQGLAASAEIVAARCVKKGVCLIMETGIGGAPSGLAEETIPKAAALAFGF